MASQATLNLFDLLIKAVDPNGHVDMSALSAARAALDNDVCGCCTEAFEGHRVEEPVAADGDDQQDVQG